MTFKDYIQGKRMGREANKLEQQALNDPFFEDAIDGFDGIQADHLSVIGELEKEIDKKSNKKSPVHLRMWILSVAAALTLLIGISVLFRQSENSPEPLAVKDIVPEAKQKELPVAKSDEYPELQENKEVVKTEPKKKPKKLIVAENKRIAAVSVEDKEDNVVEETDGNDEAVSVKSLLTVAASDRTDTDKSEAKSNPVIRIRGTSSLKSVNKQNKIIYGRVLNEHGEPMIGARVKYTSAYDGVVTDLNGRFVLPVSKNKDDKLWASYIGYQKEEISLPGDSAIFRLKPDNLALNEVIIVNKKVSPGNIDSALTGNVAGVAAGSYKFGEKEFKKYFNEHRLKYLCDGEKSTLKVKFRIDESGKPVDVQIIKCNCEELEEEFLRLIKKSPVWSKTDRTVKLTVRIN
ncbi:MAG: carboxypeptidase-like regulatory domain-containing protein [Paludibacter sp.]|nr:carboxypeptidase-like regulatory domain-containing protein [Paludibacter sp.]